jgi:hypothetical protein
MRRTCVGSLAALALGLTGALAGCGSQTKTVTVASTPAQGASAPTTQTTTNQSTATTPTTPSAAPGQAGGGTAAPTTTRTAPEPAFTEHETRAEGVAGATAAVRSRGYTPKDSSEYHAGQTLRVLVGTRTGSGDGKGQRAFFFVGERFIGTDAKQASASVKVVSQADTEVTLAYPLYRPNDPLCCPGGGQATVRFQLNNGRLTALDPIPPASSSSGLSRY